MHGTYNIKLLIIHLVLDAFMLKPICDATFVPFSAVCALCFTAHPTTTTLSDCNRHCLVTLNILPPAFVFTFVTKSPHRQ
jgi:hypothetical protein